ncbi:late exocytosis, associated with Golgi transport-domain-containing protein [Crassisporium funariophilum]|nr:late exocytosis, associated with Golgi transport-domain-containing protein [Crassisporium funariophilum]
MAAPLCAAYETQRCFSPHEAHAHLAFFGWIMPTIRTSEFTVLQIVGLDAAVLLNFFKMSFYLFSVCSLFAITILMPLNWKHNKDLDDDDDWPGDEADWPTIRKRFTDPATNRTTGPGGGPDWLDLISDANSYLSVHLIFTYLFTLLALYFIYKNYRRFIRSRQLFSLELVHSIPARTVLVSNLPNHLQGERTLAEYFENMGMAVESVTVCREVGALKTLLDRRTTALLELESAWVSYVGNPSTVEEYDPEGNGPQLLVDTDVEHGQGQNRLVVPHRKRPTLRTGWFKPKVDALEYLEAKFKEADELVKKKRRGKFRSTRAAFVTFEKMSSAQIAVQVAHAPNPSQILTLPAPEPRDIVWSNMAPSPLSLQFRDAFALCTMRTTYGTSVYDNLYKYIGTCISCTREYNHHYKVVTPRLPF